MVELSDEKIEEYLQLNTRVVQKVVGKFNITVLHANHAVLQSVVAERVSKATAVPFAIMPHGSGDRICGETGPPVPASGLRGLCRGPGDFIRGSGNETTANARVLLGSGSGRQVA